MSRISDNLAYASPTQPSPTKPTQRPQEEISSAKRSLAVSLLAITAVALLSTFLGMGLAFRTITAKTLPVSASGIGTDGWLSDGATINFDHLAPVKHTLTIQFDSWRPKHLPPATLLLNVCGEAKPAFVVAPPDPQIAMRIPAGCNSVRLNFLDWFVPSQYDQRHLGSKFRDITISSPLKIPVLKPSIYLSWFVLTLSLGALLFFTLPAHSRLRRLALFIPLLWIPLLASTAGVRLLELENFTLVAIAIALGAFIASRTSSAALSDIPISANNITSASRLLLTGVVITIVIGGFIRFYGINFGFPKMYHPDEGVKVNVINKMIDGHSWNPKYFQHPSTLLYATRIVSGALYQAGYSGTNKERIVISGRLVSATFGTISILLVYLLAARLYSPPIGLLSAAIFAVLPLHVTCSRYLKEDVLFFALFLGAVFAVVKATYDNKRAFLYLGALLVGMATSAKYSGALGAILIVAAPWIRSRAWRPDPKWIYWTLQALPLVLVGFLTLSPYAAIDFEKFYHGYHLEKMHMLTGHHASIDAWSQYWTYHLSRSFPPGMSPTLFVLSLVGVGVLLYRRRFEDLLILSLLLLFLLPAEWVRAKPAPQPERYILPCLPFLAIAASQLVDLLRKRVNLSTAVLLSVILVGAPLYRTLQLASELTNDTRAQFLRWVDNNIPPGTSFLTESRYAPRVNPKKYQFKLVSVKHYTTRLQMERLRTAPQDYLVVSSLSYHRYFSQPGTDRLIRKRFETIFKELRLVKEFKPRFGTYGFHNPTVRVYALPKSGPQVDDLGNDLL